jgi:predicted nucleic acid-binding protein
MGFKFETEDEKNTIEKLLLSFEIIQTDMEIAKLVINYRLENKIKIPDAIILATAKKLKADLVTRNTDDFINVDKSVTLSNI